MTGVKSWGPALGIFIKTRHRSIFISPAGMPATSGIRESRDSKYHGGGIRSNCGTKFSLFARLDRLAGRSTFRI